MQVFDQEDLCRKILEVDVPIITAIGHVRDQTLLERIADKSYGTPSAFGTALQELVTQNKNRKHEVSRLHKKLAEIDQVFHSSLAQRELLYTAELKEKNRKTRLLVIYGAIVISMLIMVIFFMK